MIIRDDWIYNKFKSISQEPTIGYSQTCQDEFALEFFKKSNQKRYLDVGSGCPCCMSNTLLLEKNGWTGTCIDFKDYIGYKERSCEFIKDDATTHEFESKEYEYISIDTDENTNDSIKNLIKCNVTGKFATVEHDLYLIGKERKKQQLKLMNEWGATILFSNVQHKDDINVIYEDWYIFEENISDEVKDQIDNLKKINVFGSGFRTGQQCLWLLKMANAMHEH